MTDEMDDTGATRYWVAGRVQGVGFRAATMDAAVEQGLAGWVKNLPDGRVEVHAEGDAGARGRLAAWLAQGPPASRVFRVEQRPAQREGATSFQILVRRGTDL